MTLNDNPWRRNLITFFLMRIIVGVVGPLFLIWRGANGVIDKRILIIIKTASSGSEVIGASAIIAGIGTIMVGIGIHLFGFWTPLNGGKNAPLIKWFSSILTLGFGLMIIGLLE